MLVVPKTCCIAVIGTGSIGMRHLSVLRQVPGVRPVAIPTRPGRIQHLTEAGYFAVKDLFEAVRASATHCIVATDTGRHVEDALAALANQIDVLVEKPLSTNAQQASQLCMRAVHSGRKIFVGCVLRFAETLNTFRNLQSRIGRLHSVRIECQSYLPHWRPDRPYEESYSARADEGGVLRDLIHEIDYAGWLFGWPVVLEARLRNLGRLRIAAEEAADLAWETPQGCVISMSLDYLSRPSRRYVRASGEFGTLEWDGTAGEVTLMLASEGKQVFRSTQTTDEMLLAQDIAFIEACRGHPDPRLATCEDGAKALAVCDAARLAARNRREEEINYH